MGQEFSITYERVSEISKNLRKNADSMLNILEEVTERINSVHSNYWESSAATEHLNQYNTLKLKYDAFYQEVIKMADFLDNAVSANQEADTSVQNAIG